MKMETNKNIIRFTRRQWLGLGLAAAAMLLWIVFQPSIFDSRFVTLPGFGMTLWVGLTFSALLLWSAPGKKFSRRGTALLTLTVALSLVFSLRADKNLWLMNLPVQLGLMALTCLELRGEANLFTFRGLMGGLGRCVAGLFRYLPRPFQAATTVLFKQEGNRRMKGFLLGVVLCVPLLAIVVLLLSDADSVFGGYFQNLISAVQTADGAIVLWAAVRFLAGTLMLCSLCCFMGLAPAPEEKPAVPTRTHAAMPATVLAALAAVYLLFAYVQFRYLFFAAGIPAQGYAQYARSGFFQLVAVAFLTLMVVLPCVCCWPGSRAVRGLAGLVTLLTLVILVSAAWRMALYVQAFGLTILRVVTLWGMLALAIALIAALAKALRPRLKIAAPVLMIVVASWILLNYANINARIAEYNVRAWEAQPESVRLDVPYLAYSLYPASAPVLEELYKDHPELELPSPREQPGWFDSSVDWLIAQ